MGESGGTGGAFVLSERATNPNPGDLLVIVLVSSLAVKPRSLTHPRNPFTPESAMEDV